MPPILLSSPLQGTEEKDGEGVSGAWFGVFW